jgi:hypothetical protein
LPKDTKLWKTAPVLTGLDFLLDRGLQIRHEGSVEGAVACHDSVLKPAGQWYENVMTVMGARLEITGDLDAIVPVAYPARLMALEEVPSHVEFWYSRSIDSPSD